MDAAHTPAWPMTSTRWPGPARDGKVRVGQGRVDDARVAFAEAREGLLAGVGSTRCSTSRPGWPSAPPWRATWRERSSRRGDRHGDADRTRDRPRRLALPPRAPAAATGSAPRRRAGVSAGTGLTRRGGRWVRSGPQPARPQPGPGRRRTPGREEPALRARDAARAGRGGLPTAWAAGWREDPSHGPFQVPKEQDDEDEVAGVVPLARHVVGAELLRALDDTLGRAGVRHLQRAGRGERRFGRVEGDALAGALGLVALQQQLGWVGAAVDVEPGSPHPHRTSADRR